MFLYVASLHSSGFGQSVSGPSVSVCDTGFCCVSHSVGTGFTLVGIRLSLLNWRWKKSLWSRSSKGNQCRRRKMGKERGSPETLSLNLAQFVHILFHNIFARTICNFLSDLFLIKNDVIAGMFSAKENTVKFKLNFSLSCNFGYIVLSQRCTCAQLWLRHKHHLVRVWKTSWIGLKFLFW